MRPLLRFVPWRQLGIFALFGLGAALFTYPLVARLGSAVTDHGDPLLDAWSLSWLAYQLPRDPVHLFDANRFYPETGTFAFTDPMIGLGLLVAPVQWVVNDALVGLNVAMLLSLTVSGYGAYRLGRAVTGSEAGGAVAGSVFLFNPFRLSHLSHVQLQTSGFIPLLYLSLRRYLEDGRARFAVGVGVFLWLVCASSAYYGIFTWLLLGIAVPYEVWRTKAFRNRKRLVGLGLALAASAVVFVPVALPFMRLGSDFGLRRPIARLSRASARPADYLRSGGHVHRAIGLDPPSSERTLFPGIVALGLGLLAVAKLNRSTLLYLLLGGAAVWMSLGPRFGLYGWLHAVVPGLSGIRVPPRIGIYVMLAVAVLAGAGAAVALEKIRTRALGPFTAALLVLTPLAESFGGPISYTSAPGIPSVYRWVATLPHPTPLVEMPLPPAGGQAANAVYMYWSTTHFQPIANGYGAVIPPVYSEIAAVMARFPTESGTRLLRELGFRYVILHRDRYLRARAREVELRMDGAPGLRRVLRTEEASVYAIRLPSEKGEVSELPFEVASYEQKRGQIGGRDVRALDPAGAWAAREQRDVRSSLASQQALVVKGAGCERPQPR